MRSRADVAWVTSLGLSWCLPWLVAALVGTSGRGQREGAAAFAVRADGGWGVLEVLSGGGIWSPAAALCFRAMLGPRIGSLLV